jgi:Flp pilus assembly protein TadB
LERVSLRAMIGVGVLLGALYAVGMIVRGDVLPGLVGGALAAVLCVIVLRRVEERRRDRR